MADPSQTRNSTYIYLILVTCTTNSFFFSLLFSAMTCEGGWFYSNRQLPFMRQHQIHQRHLANDLLDLHPKSSDVTRRQRKGQRTKPCFIFVCQKTQILYLKIKHHNNGNSKTCIDIYRCMMVCDRTLFLTIVSGPNFPLMSGPLLTFCKPRTWSSKARVRAPPLRLTPGPN